MAMLIIILNNIPTELHRSPHTDYDGDACGVNSSGNVGYDWDVASSSAKLMSGGFALRTSTTATTTMCIS